MLCADPYVKTDPSLVSQDEVMDRRRPPGYRAPPSPLRRAVHGQTGGRHLGHQRPGSAGVKPRVSVVVTAREEGEAITGALELIGEAVKLSCEILVVCDSREDSTVPWVEKYAKEDDRVRLVLNNNGPGRPGPYAPVLRPPWPTWWSSRWRTAVTTPSRSTSSPGWSNGAWS